MRVLFLIILIGCASRVRNIQEPWVKELLGKKGFITRGVAIYADSGQSSTGSIFKRCEKVSVVEIAKHDHYYYTVYFKQENNTFYIKSPYHSKEKFLKYFNEIIKGSIDVPNRKVKLRSGVKFTRDLLCQGMIWTGMKPVELIFVKGNPVKKNRTVSGYGVSEQWIYGDFRFGKQSYYYFRGKSDNTKVLTSWQN